MSANQEKDFGRTQWDVLMALLRNRKVWSAIAVISPLIVAGAALALWTGVVTVQRPNSQTSRPLAAASITCERYGVTINRRSEPAHTNQVVEVSGTVDSLPQGFQLWLVATSPPSMNEYFPRQRVTITGRSWSTRIQPASGRPGDTQRFAVIMAGRDGQILFESYVSIVRALQATTRPALTQRTSDTAECEGRHEVVLSRPDSAE